MSGQFGTIFDIAVNHSSNNTIYLASNQGISRSINAGKSWHSYSRGLDGDSISRIITSKDLILCKGRNGIYRLSDESLSWAASIREQDK